VGRHEAYRPTVGERVNDGIDVWLDKRGVSRPKLPSIRWRRAMPTVAFLFVSGITAVTVIDPYAGNSSAAYADYFFSPDYTQQQANDFVVTAKVSFARGGYDILSGSAFSKLYVADAGVPDAGTSQAFARTLIATLGWGQDQYSCLVKLWNRESHWNPLAMNTGSGAYGIPQALPGIRMASEGSDWQTNPETQIHWGVKYIQGRYKNACNALVHSNNFGWY